MTHMSMLNLWFITGVYSEEEPWRNYDLGFLIGYWVEDHLIFNCVQCTYLFLRDADWGFRFCSAGLTVVLEFEFPSQNLETVGLGLSLLEDYIGLQPLQPARNWSHNKPYIVFIYLIFLTYKGHELPYPLHQTKQQEEFSELQPCAAHGLLMGNQVERCADFVGQVCLALFGSSNLVLDVESNLVNDLRFVDLVFFFLRNVDFYLWWKEMSIHWI